MALDQFALARQRAQQRSLEDSQRQGDALKRRFAALGTLDSGAQLKIEQNANDASARNLEDANAGIDAAETQEKSRKQELQDNRDFSRSERMGSQQFASTEAGKGRQFATSERLGGQAYGSGEAMKGRQFATSERLGGQQYSSGEAALGRGFQTSERLGSQNFAGGQAAMQRRYATSEREAGQDFGRSERLSSQSFGADQARNARDFQSNERQQSQTYASGEKGKDREFAQGQFDKTFAEEQYVNRENIRQNDKQMAQNAKGPLGDFGNISLGDGNMGPSGWDVIGGGQYKRYYEGGKKAYSWVSNKGFGDTVFS